VSEQLLHPDLDNIPYLYDWRARLDLISVTLSSSRGLLLDVTPGWGHFLHRFEALGFDCTGMATVEEDRCEIETPSGMSVLSALATSKRKTPAQPGVVRLFRLP